MKPNRKPNRTAGVPHSGVASTKVCRFYFRVLSATPYSGSFKVGSLVCRILSNMG